LLVVRIGREFLPILVLNVGLTLAIVLCEMRAIETSLLVFFGFSGFEKVSISVAIARAEWRVNNSLGRLEICTRRHIFTAQLLRL
jgi:hypothetical protein